MQAQIYSFWKQLLSPLAPFLPLALSLMSLSSLSQALLFFFPPYSSRSDSFVAEFQNDLLSSKRDRGFISD